MAKIDMVGLAEVEQAFFKMGPAAAKAVPAMLDAGAQVLIDVQKAEAAMLNKSGRSLGGLAKSPKATPVKSSGSSMYKEVYPHGKDHNHTKKGVDNAVKGFVLEHGRRNMPSYPWMAPANEKAADKITDAMMKVWESCNGSN